MHFPFDTGKTIRFKHKTEVMHFPFDTENFPFDTGISVTHLFTTGYFSANSTSNIITNSRGQLRCRYCCFLN